MKKAKAPKKTPLKATKKATAKKAPAKKITDKEVCQAAEKGTVAQLTKLLKAGGNPNAVIKDGKYTRSTALYLANGTRKQAVEKVKALLAAGADVNYHRNLTLSAIDRFIRSDDVAGILAPLANAKTRAMAERILRIGNPDKKVDNMLRLARMFLGKQKFAKLESEIQQLAEQVAANQPGAFAKYKKIIQ